MSRSLATTLLSCLPVSLVTMIAMGLAGCGGSSAPPSLPTSVVEGAVLMDDKPVVGAQVLFLPIENTKGFGGMAVSDAQGLFKIDQPGAAGVIGLPEGKYRVTVQTYQPPEDPTLAAEFEVPAGATKAIPAVYAAVERSPLEVMVALGDQPLKLELNSKAR